MSHDQAGNGEHEQGDGNDGHGHDDRHSDGNDGHGHDDRHSDGNDGHDDRHSDGNDGHGHGRHDHDHGHNDRDGGHDHGHNDRDGGHGHDHDHAHHAGNLETVGYAVVTVSSSRTLSDDPSGDTIVSAIETAGDEIVVRELVGDDLDTIQGTVDRLVDRDDVDCVVTTGGTGVTPDDVTIEAVEPLFEKRLPGFGELFRSLSREEVGTAVVATRATAGVTDGVAVFCLPGSENAARLGSERIITREAAHLAGLARE